MLPIPSLILTAALALVASYALIPSAQAETNRRICVYSDATANGTHSWNVIDNTKDGDCPIVWSTEVNTQSGRAPKMTCEDFTKLLGTPSTPDMNLETDACPTFTDDHVYLVEQNEADKTYHWSDRGHRNQFQRSIRFDAKLGVTKVYRFCASTFDKDGKKLRSDCDSVGAGGTSRLFYDPGTVKVEYFARVIDSLTKRGAGVNVINSQNETLNYCVDAKWSLSKGTAYSADYC